ncbi:MAG: hypothetical protein KDA93_06710 [Planctomycetaceae bacterium]|nr:hypothetical protein [Planctomycetaceae bacterium]
MKHLLRVCLSCVTILVLTSYVHAEFRVGAATVDVTPDHLPVLVNGGMLSRTIDTVNTRLHARSIVLDDGNERLAIVVVDSCMMPRPLLDDAKALAATRTEIATDRMLISATHTHSAPSTMSCLGTEADDAYVPFLRERLAEAIAAAEANLEPAQVGWAVGNAAEYTALRRWIRRPDRIVNDPFGNPTVRANMHAGANWDDVTGESGPEDPDLSLIAFQSTEGRPIAVLANFSMHYFSDQALSADYFGLFCEGLQQHLGTGASDDHPPFVGVMSHGCSGDIWRRDYKIPADKRNDAQKIDEFSQGLLNIALETYDTIEYQSEVDLAMAETRMQLNYRVPDQQRLEWSKQVVAEMGERPPKDTTEVYAREQIILYERQSTEIVLQALRIGDIAIATTPNETYALSGLKLKLQSPLSKTMVIELANGGDGYIPPPEQHLLGGYNTWPARSAGLEVTAEPKIVEADLQLLEQVATQPRHQYRQSRGALAQAVLDAKPIAYWRLDEFAGPLAADATGNDHAATYEPGVVFFLEGPESHSFCVKDETNRAAHFAGGRLRSSLSSLDVEYSMSLWCWNGMPTDAHEMAGWMFSRDRDHGVSSSSVHLGLGGTSHPGKLVLLHNGETLAGRTPLERWTWHHVVLVCVNEQTHVYLDGNPEPEISVESEVAATPINDLFFGGRSDNQSNWEGRLDEIAIFDRALSPDEVETLSAE